MCIFANAGSVRSRTYRHYSLYCECNPCRYQSKRPAGFLALGRERVGVVQPRVLIIEPDEAIASLIALALRDEGYATACAHDAGHALALLCDHGDYDLILSTPLAPPGMEEDGYNWLERLRAHTRAPIVVCVRELATRYADYAARSFAAVLEEPFDLSDMLNRVAALCQHPASPDEQGALAPGKGKQW